MPDNFCPRVLQKKKKQNQNKQKNPHQTKKQPNNKLTHPNNIAAHLVRLKIPCSLQKITFNHLQFSCVSVIAITYI